MLLNSDSAAGQMEVDFVSVDRITGTLGTLEIEPGAVTKTVYFFDDEDLYTTTADSGQRVYLDTIIENESVDSDLTVDVSGMYTIQMVFDNAVGAGTKVITGGLYVSRQLGASGSPTNGGGFGDNFTQADSTTATAAGTVLLLDGVATATYTLPKWSGSGDKWRLHFYLYVDWSGSGLSGESLDAYNIMVRAFGYRR
jgi:hypothetical protein